jgi:hypothetical protein
MTAYTISSQRRATAAARNLRQSLPVRVRPLSLAAAIALGAPCPWALAQTVIRPLEGAAATQTVVTTTKPGVHTVTTGTLRDGNAFNHLSALQVARGDMVGLVVPQGANWLVNVVRDSRVQVDGRLQGQLSSGAVGGNLLFIDSHGFAVGSSGSVQAGRLVFAAPSTSFVDRLLGEGAGFSSGSVSAVLRGNFDRSSSGAVRIDGEVQARDGVHILAGGGVSVSGQISVDGRRGGPAVNVGHVRSLSPLVERDGIIEITTPQDIVLNGKLIADGSHWASAGAIRVVAGGDVRLGSDALLSANALKGSNEGGGSVTVFAHGSASNAAGAKLSARGDGAGDGGFVEYSATKKVSLDGLILDAGTDTGRNGQAYIDPEDIEITSDVTVASGTDALYEATRSVTVASGVTISTRQTGELVNGAGEKISIADSGNLVIKAPTITVGVGSVLDASAVNAGGSSWQAGDITLLAQASSEGQTLVTLSDANALIDVAGTLKGRNITLEASVVSDASFGGVTGSIQQEAVNLALEALDAPLSLSLAYVEAKGDAKVTLRPTAVLTAGQDIGIAAKAERSASAEVQTEGTNKLNLSAGFAQVSGTTEVDVQSGARLTAGGQIDLVAASKTTVGMSAAAAGETDEDTGQANVASVVFAGSRSNISTSVKVGTDAVITSVGDTRLQAYHIGQYETTADVTVYGGGTAGVVGALSLQKSSTSVQVNGDVQAGGHVRVMALNVAPKNVISATAANATAEEESLKDEMGLPDSLEMSEDDAVEGAQQTLFEGFMSLTEAFSDESEAASAGQASDSPSDSKPPALRLAGALTWSESDHTTRAVIGANARVTAGADAVVDAQSLIGQLKSVTTSEATSETEGEDGSKIGLGVAFAYGDHTVTTRAEVDEGAEINAGHVAVHAATDIPEFYTAGLPTDWSSFSAAYENLMGGTDFLYDGFNTQVGATSAATDLAAAGAVSLLFMKNDTRAWVDKNATLTTTVTDGLPWSYEVREIGFDSDLVEMISLTSPYSLDKDLGVLGGFVSQSRQAPAGPDLDQIDFARHLDAAVTVRAQSHVQTLHHAGGSGPEAGGEGGSVGGTFAMVRRDNTTVAGIADGVEITTERLDVAAETSDWILTISPTSGGGEGIAANGIASYNDLRETTLASISNEARVQAPVVNVDARLALGVLAVTGAVTESENSGVGIGIAINEMTANTKAYVGDNDGDGGGSDTAEGPTGYIRTGSLGVRARNDGMIVAIGVAGASAGQEEQPADEATEQASAPPNTGQNLAKKAETQSATQGQIDGNGATVEPLAQASAPAEGEGTDQADSQAPDGGKPPSFSIAGAGAIVTNFSDLDVFALIDGASISGRNGGSTSVLVQGVSDVTQVSVAGGGALAAADNSSTTFSAAMAGAVAIQQSDDDTVARIRNSTISDLSEQTDSLSVLALKGGERTAVATGISLNLSKGSTTSLSVVGSVSATHTSDDTEATLENSQISGKSLVPAATGVQVLAYDRSRIGAGGGALSVSTGKGSAGVGAAISIVDSTGSSQAVVSGGNILRVHDLTVAALSSQKVVGVAAVGGIQTDASSKGQLMGSFVVNRMANTVHAGVKGGARVNLSGDLALQAGGSLSAASITGLNGRIGEQRDSMVTDYEMTSSSNGYTDEFRGAVGGESIVGVAGTLGVSLGGNSGSVGLSYAHNDIQTTYDAELQAEVTATGGVSVRALSEADIVGVAAGLGASKGKFTGMGSAAVNLIGQRTQAIVTDSNIQAASLEVSADTGGNSFAMAGNLSFAVGSGEGSAAGASVAYTQTGTKTYNGDGGTLSTRAAGNAAAISDSRVSLGAGALAVKAQNTSDTRSIAAAGAAADGNVGFAGTVTVNEMADVTSASVLNTLATAGSVLVSAGEASGGRTASIQSLAGGLSASKGYSGALAMGINTIESTRSAHIGDSNLIVGNSVTVEAAAQGAIRSLSATLAGGKDYAGALSSSANTLNGTVSATYDGGGNSLRGTATSLQVVASGSGLIESMAGSVSGAGTGAIGAAVAVNLMGHGGEGFGVTAALSDLELLAPVAVQVKADLAGSIGSVAASGSGAGTAAVNGSVTVNTIEADVLAHVDGLRQTTTGTSLLVQARNEADIDSLAGTVSGAGNAAVGAAVSVNDIGGQVTAKTTNSTLRASGAVSVLASMSGDIRSVAAGLSGSGSVSAAGSNTTNGITSTVQAQLLDTQMLSAASSLTVQARDESRIESLAGTVAGGGSAGGGAALALNFLGRTAADEQGAKLVKAEVARSLVRTTGQALVQANSTSTIRSVGVAAGGGLSAALNGSNSTNLLEDQIQAIWTGSNFNYSSGNSLVVQARQASTIDSLAGNLSGTAGAAVGAALAVNRIGSATEASLVGVTNARFNSNDGYWTTWADDQVVSAQSDNQINTVAVGMSAGSAGAQGSVAVSVIDSQTRATLGASGHVTNAIANDSVAVTAHSRDRIRALAGATALGAGGVGAAGGVLTNIISSNVTAGVAGFDTHINAYGNGAGLTVHDDQLASRPDLMNISQVSDAVLEGASFGTRTVKGLAVQATGIQQIGALTAVAGGGASGAAGAAVNVDQIGGSTRAYIDSARFINDSPGGAVHQSVDVMAANHAMVASSAAAVAIGGTGGVSGAIGTESIVRTTKTELTGGTIVHAVGDVNVEAVSSNTVAQISAGAAGSGVAGVAGSGDVVLMHGQTIAQVNNATVRANNIAVVANGSNHANLVAGSIGGGGAVGVGLSFTVASSGSTVKALVKDATLAADGAIVVDADNTTESLSVSASAAVGGTAGVAVGASVTVMEGATEASVTGSTNVTRRTKATGLLASAGDAPVTVNLASGYDVVGTTGQKDVRFSLSDLNGRVISTVAEVTVTDGEITVPAIRLADGTYSADLSSLADGLIMAEVKLPEGGIQKVASTTLLKSTGINGSDTPPGMTPLPQAQTRISTLSGFEQVDARNQRAVHFVLKDAGGPTADSTAQVIVSDGTRSVVAVANADGSYTADVSGLGDGILTARVSVPSAQAGGADTTARVTFVKNAGAASLSITADEQVVLNHNAGQIGVGGVAGVGSSANVVVGKSTVDASLNAQSVRVGGELKVQAQRDANIDMVTATAGGGGFTGVSGAVGVLVFGSAPDSNANAELTGSSSTMGQIGTATQSNRTQGTGSALTAQEAASLSDSASYDTGMAFAGASGLHRTSATVAAQSVVAGSLQVHSLDRTSVDNNAGAVALGGVAGVSAGVAVTLLGGANHAGVSVGDLAVGGDVNITSGTRTHSSGTPSIESRAIAGAGGFVGVGAAVSVARNETANTASLAGTLSADGSVQVLALDQTSLLSEAYGATAGFVSVGVVSATADQTGSVGTLLAGRHTGQGFSAVAQRDAQTTANATGGSAGVYAGAGAAATASDRGSVSLTLADGLDIDAGTGNLVLSASANPKADTSAIGVSVGRTAGMGVSVATSSIDTAVHVRSLGGLALKGNNLLVSAVLGSGNSAVTSYAVAGGGGLLLGTQGAAAVSTNAGSVGVDLRDGAHLDASASVGISSSDSMRVASSATGVGAGFVGAGVAVALSNSSTTVHTDAGALSGRVQGNLNVSARGDEIIDADAVAGSGGVIAGAGAQAEVDHVQHVVASARTVAAGITVDGTTTISADRKARYDSQTETINASVLGASGAVTKAKLTGSATALLDDQSRLTGGQLRVLATNQIERLDLAAASARGGGGGVLAGAGADVQTTINGTATAELGDDVSLALGGNTLGLLELRAYNQLRGSSVGRMDLGGAVPIALVDTEIRSTANANATVGQRNNIQVAGEVFVNAMSYVDIEANTITKTYGAAAGAQGDALAHATVNNTVNVGADSEVIGEYGVTLLAGQDRDFWRNKSFVTARADLFNHSAVPVSVNPDADARLTLNNHVNVFADAVRSGGTVKLGGIEGTYVVQGKGKVSDWTRDLGEVVGISSEYGSTTKNLAANTQVHGLIEAGYGNKQILVIKRDGSIDASKTQGNIRYSISTEDLAATGAAYLDTLYEQLKNYGDIPEVRAFVEAEIAFYLDTLVREGFATIETDPETGLTQVVPQESVPGTFLNLQNVRAGSGNIELFGNNVTGTANLVARADSEILIDNHSPMNIRTKDLIIDSSGGFAKYNGIYLTDPNGADIASFNRDVKTGLALKVDSIDTRGGGVGEELPKLQVINRYQPTGQLSSSAVMATAPDGSSADLRQDEMRAPEIRVNGLLYNKLGSINLSNLAGSIAVVQEDANAVPRLDGLEVQVNAGKNFVLSSPSVSQSVGGSPENLYAVAYTDDQQRKLDAMGIVRCGTARAGVPSATSFTDNCLRQGSGGIYASGGIFLGARYLNINGTIQSGQPDYKVTLTNASVGSTINAWETEWTSNRGSYLAEGRSSLVQVAGRRPTDNEADINKQFANGSITAARRDQLLAEMDARRAQPVVYYDAEDNRLKVAATDATGGLVEVVGSIINTGGGVIRALDGYARFDIDNQTGYGLDLLGLDTGGDKGVIRITDLNRPVIRDGRIVAYKVTTYQRDDNNVYRAITTEGRGGEVVDTSNSTLSAPNAQRPELRATFSYSPVKDSTYVWSAGYEFGQEKRYWYQKSSALWGAINLGSINWNSVQTINKTSSAMPEGIYVTTDGAPAKNFTMSALTIPAGPERQIYYRTWKKCGFLCFKKTYYVDYRTEVAQKDVFTQRVRADHPIAIELVGYSTGQIDVNSKGDIRLAGAITNDSGLVKIDSAHGAITQLSGGTAVSGNDLRFYAAKGIGDEGAPINVITGNGSFTAQSDSGNIAFQSLGGALRINEVATTGKVWLLGDESIVGVNPNAVHVRGSRIELAAPRGGIGEFNENGTVKSTLNIQTEDSAGGGITAHAGRGIALKQGQGNLWVNQVASNGGDVYIETAGDLIDNNRNETRDVRTEEELLSLWNAAALQGSGAEQSRQLTLSNTRAQYRRYWSLRNAQTTSVNPVTGEVIAFTADAYDPDTYQFSFSIEEKTRLSQTGLSAVQIGEMEAARTQELKELHSRYGSTTYQVNDNLIIAQVNSAMVASGSAAVDANATWSDAELRSPLPKAIFNKSTTDTQTRIEEPNVVGNRVVLRPGGKIGRDEGSVVIDLRKEGGLTVEDQLTIMSAESDDMSLDRDNWLLTVVKKDTFNVLSNKLNVQSSGFVYLGADTTDAYPTGGNANLEQVTGNGEIRIKVSGSILNASNSSAPVIQGHKAILEAANGSIGTADKAVSLHLTGGGSAQNATLVARAQDGIWITQPGDIRVADIYSPGMVSLTANGSIIDARGGDRTRALEAGEANLVALGGSVGTQANPFVAKVNATGGISASTPLGYSVYLQGAETGLAVKDINSGLHVQLRAPQQGVVINGDVSARGWVDVQSTKGMSVQGITAGQDITLATLDGQLTIDGQLTATGRIDVTAEGESDLVMGSQSGMRAISGDIYVSADQVGLGKLDAARSVVVVADGNITDNTAEADAVNVAGVGITLVAAGGIGTRAKPVDVLTRQRSKLVATAAGDAFLSAGSGSMRISQVSAGGDAVLSSAYDLIDDRGTRAQAVHARNIELVAGGDIGQTTVPMTVKTAAGGAVRNAAAGGSLNLYSPEQALNLLQGSAVTGRMAINGGVAGLSLDGVLSAGQGMSLNAGQHSLAVGSNARLTNANGSLVMQGSTITMSQGAIADGRAGTLVLSATGDITVTGLRSANNTAGAVVVSTSAGSILDGGDIEDDIRITSVSGAAVLSASGSIGDTSLAADAVGRRLEVNAPVLTLTSKAGSVAIVQSGATSNATISARMDAELQGTGSINATKVASSGGSVLVTSESGGVKINSVSTAQDLLVTAGGRINLASVRAPRDITLVSNGGGTGLAPTGSGQGITAQSITAGRHLSIIAQGQQAHSSFSALTASGGSLSVNNEGTLKVTGTTSASGVVQIDMAGAGALGTVSSRLQNVTITSDAALRTGRISAPGAVSLSSEGQLTTGAVSSTGAQVVLSAHNGGISYGSVSAGSVASLSATRDAGSAMGTDVRGGAITAKSQDPVQAIQAASENGNLLLGNLSATTGGVTLVAGGGLTTGTVRAISGIAASGSQNVTMGALTSSTGAIDVNAFTGSVSLASATAREGLRVQAGAALSLGSFTVSGGNATLKASTTLSLPRGSASGLVDVSAGGVATLGALTSTKGAIYASSTGNGLTFATLRAANGIRLRASTAMGSGVQGSFGLIGTTLDAGNGALDAHVLQGDVQIGTLSARSNSVLTAQAGSLRVNTIRLLRPFQLAATAQGGVRVLPSGY